MPHRRVQPRCTSHQLPTPSTAPVVCRSLEIGYLSGSGADSFDGIRRSRHVRCLEVVKMIGDRREVPRVYWEQQGSDRMCALHCLNSLLQGPHYTESELAAVAAELDKKERQLMAEMGESSEDFRHFVSEGSHNVADDGFFSVSVIEQALYKFGIYCIPAHKPEVAASLNDPTIEEAFLCNHSDHWLAIRLVNRKWYNLDSLKAAPREISDFYLSAFLRGLTDQGYSIFIIRPDVTLQGQRLNGPSPHAAGEKNLPPAGGFSQLHLPATASRYAPHQMYLTEADIKKMHALAAEDEKKSLLASQKIAEETDGPGGKDGGGGKSFLLGKPTSPAHEWPTSEGRRLGASSAPTSSGVTDPLSGAPSSSGDDPEIVDEVQQALRLSMLDFLASLPKPPPEPSRDLAGCHVIQVRFPNGLRYARRFSGEDMLLHVFTWLEVESTSNEKGRELDPPLAIRDSYSLTSSAFGLGTRLTLWKLRGDVEVKKGDDDTTPNASNLPLSSLGMETQCTFNLQL